MLKLGGRLAGRGFLEEETLTSNYFALTLATFALSRRFYRRGRGG